MLGFIYVGIEEFTVMLNSQVGRGKLSDPLKYEEWIDDKTRILKECDPHIDLMLFPDDDIEVFPIICYLNNEHDFNKIISIQNKICNP